MEQDKYIVFNCDLKNFYHAVEYTIFEFDLDVADVEKMLSLLFVNCRTDILYDFVIDIYKENMNYYSDRSVDVIPELFLDFYKLYLKFDDYCLLAK